MKYIKFIIFAMLLILIAYILSLLLLKSPPAPTGKEIYIVKPNDTLWDISKDYCPQDMDIREYIFAVERYNDIDGYIRVGQEIQMLVF